MAFKKIENPNFNNEEIAGFWTRVEGEVIIGNVVKLVESLNVKWPFLLIKLTEDGGTIIHEEETTDAKSGMLIGILSSKALEPLSEMEGELVRITSNGEMPITVKDPTTGRKTPGKFRAYTIEVDESATEPPPF